MNTISPEPWNVRYNPDGSATIIDQCGQYVASFRFARDAELCIEHWRTREAAEKERDGLETEVETLKCRMHNEQVNYSKLFSQYSEVKEKHRELLTKHADDVARLEAQIEQLRNHLSPHATHSSN